MRRLARLSSRDGLFLLAGAVIVLIIWGIVTLVTHSHLPLKPQAATITSPWIPPTVKRWETPIDAAAKKYQLDPNFIAIIMTMESGGDPNAKSSDGAQGLMQITGPTAKDIGPRYLKQPVSNNNLNDPATNIEYGVAYLSELRDVFGGWEQGPSWNYTAELVAAGYNGGPGAANSLFKGDGLTDTQTVVYSRDALNMWRERFAKDSPTFDRWKERGGQVLIDNAKKYHP